MNYLMAAFLGAAIFLLPAGLAVKRILPSDILLRQELDFAPVCGPVQWELFVQGQRLELLAVADRLDPRLQRRLSVRSEEMSRRLVVSLRAGGDSELRDSFRRLIDSYLQQHTTVSASAARRQSRDLTDADRTYRDVLVGCLDRHTDRQLQLEQRLDELQDEYDHLAVESITLERHLGSDRPPEDFDFEMFAEHIRPDVDVAVSSDATLVELQRNLSDFRDRIAELDIRAGRCTSAKLLDSLEFDRDRLHRRSYELERLIGRRRVELTEQVASDAWPTFRLSMQSYLAQCHRRLAENSVARRGISQSIGRSRQNLCSVGKELGQFESDNISQQPAGPLAIAAASAELTQPLAATVESEVLSVPQYMFLLVAILLGCCLGLLSVTLAPLAGGLRNTGASATAVAADDATDRAVDTSTTDSSWHSQYDRAVAAVGRLRTQISCPAILLTAADSADASPRIAVNLAIALVRDGMDILLIEADGGDLDLTAVFEADEREGFAQLTAGRIAPDRAICDTHLPGLAFIPFGRAESIPDASKNAPVAIDISFWTLLREKFDVLLVYSPSAAQSRAGSAEKPYYLFDIADACFTLSRRPGRSGGGGKKAQRLKALLLRRSVKFLGVIDGTA